MIMNLLAQLQNRTALPKVTAGEGNLNNALAVFFGIIAALAVLSIMIAAFNFATANGDADKISRSKKTIILALIGLAIAIAAELIVITVLTRL